MRRRRRRIRVLRVKRRGRVTLRGLCGQLRAGVLVGFQMTLGPLDGCLGGLIFGGRRGSGARRFGGGNGLARITHFLHGRAGHAPEQAGDSD
jgi:hypothetical protein